MTSTARSPFQGMLRGSVVCGLGSALLCGTGAALLHGRYAAGSAAAGALSAAVVLTLGLLGIRLVVSGDPGISMAGALVVYLGQLILLVAALLVLRAQPWLDGRAFALGAILATVAVQAGQVAGYVRGRHVMYPRVGEVAR